VISTQASLALQLQHNIVVSKKSIPFFFSFSGGVSEEGGDGEGAGSAADSLKKIKLHYRQLYLNRPDPISFLTVSVETSVRIYGTIPAPEQ